MEEKEQEEQLITVDIPPIFYSDAQEAPFRQCTMCECDLSAPDAAYVIEKAIKRHPEFNYTDTIFEYAICMGCHKKMMARFSESSKQKIAEYFSKQVDLGVVLGNNIEESMQEQPTGLPWLQRCVIKGTAVDELSEYQFAGHFKGDKMVLNEPPVLLSGAAVDEIQELISPETKGEIDDFTDEFLGLPPEYKLALKNGDLVLV